MQLHEDALILVLDSTTNTVMVEISMGSQVLAAKLKETRSFVSEIPVILRDALNDAEVEFSDINLLSAVTGPGSWTGIRVGTTIIKSVAFATGADVVPIPTLNIPFEIKKETHSGKLATMMPAGSEKIFWTLAEPEDDCSVSGLEVTYSDLSDANAILAPQKPTKVFWMGDKPIPQKLNLEFVEPFCTFNIAAGQLSMIAKKYANAGRTTFCHDLNPSYHVAFRTSSRSK